MTSARIYLIFLFFTSSLSLELQTYLSRFGYLKVDIGNLNAIISGEEISSAVSNFQKFFGLPVTGKLDARTEKVMNYPRCGVIDRPSYNNSDTNPFVLLGSKWPKKSLRYKIMKYPHFSHELPNQSVDETIKKAFDFWAKYTDLKFSPGEDAVDIHIKFVSGNHGDGSPFEGPNGVLAHAFPPVSGGTTHFDDAEQWTLNSHHGINLLQVATHEFGHALGLDHTGVLGAVMAPFYQGYERNFDLHSDDIRAIRSLYGSKSGGDKVDEPSDDECPPCWDCSDPGLDTILMLPDEQSYIFKGTYFWKYAPNGQIQNGYPQRISDVWVGLPSDLDATYQDGSYYYFFKGSKVWSYYDRTLVSGYPKEISVAYPGIPSNIDAVIKSSYYLYFFKDCKFWRFDTTTRQTTSKKISDLTGVPNHLDGGYVRRGRMYFVKNLVYYLYSENDRKVTNVINQRLNHNNNNQWSNTRSYQSQPIML